ncbi:glycosyltransferase family 2 protein [Peribacillus sp. FSL M8-0224]|uniref:glycosyltransferase family 2 protein n=1 Tax=Peribacillus sp. FSL M8-0224 TaxID=2921568 RepID=UPI0030F8835D
MEKISVVIPIYNGINETLKCLQSLNRVNYKNLDIIIIDDGSTDDSKEIISKKFPHVTILNGDGNLWWSGGVNKGIKYALENDSQFVVLLNNDNIVNENFLDELLKVNKNNDNSIVASLVYSSNTGKIIHAGGYFDIKQGLKLYNDDMKLKSNLNPEIEWCGGMGVLIPRSVFLKIGLFDNINFPQYYGDADFMYRARKENIKILLSSKSIVWNNEDTTGLSPDANSFKELINVLTSVKSNNNFRKNWKFYFRHFGLRKSAIVIITRYGYIIGGFIKRNVKRSL